MQNVVMKKIYLLRDFAAGVYLTQNPIPNPPPLFTLYSVLVYMSIFIHTGNGGGGGLEPERRVEWDSHKAGSKIPT